MKNQVVRSDGDAGLSAEELAALRENLEDQRRFRLEQLQQIAETAQYRPADGGARPSGQPADRDESLTEIGVKLAASARMVLADVEAALQRMEQGCYGACHLCARPIPAARLAVVPQARYCARCHQFRERGR